MPKEHRLPTSDLLDETSGIARALKHEPNHRSRFIRDKITRDFCRRASRSRGDALNPDGTNRNPRFVPVEKGK
jgi:hypothetical protein